VFSISDSNVPWFEVLFPDTTLPALTDSKLEKADFNPLFKSIASYVKYVLKTELDLSVSHLPRPIATKIEEVIIKSTIKSTQGKCPAKTLKSSKKKHPFAIPSKKSNKPVSPPAPKAQPKEKKEKPSPKKAATPAPVPPPTSSVSKTKSKASAKTAAPTTKKSPGTPTKSVSSTVSHKDALQVLTDTKSPKFFYPSDKTPTFQTLFPGTTMPKFTKSSGNVSIAKADFQPLLLSRVRSAHHALRNAKMQVTRLPAKFMNYQTRLITRSIEQSVKERKDKATTKKSAKSDKKKSTKEQVVFVPQQVPDTLSAPTINKEDSTLPEDSDSVYNLRELRTLLSSKVAEMNVPGSSIDKRLTKKLLAHPSLPTLFAPSTLAANHGSNRDYVVSGHTVSFISRQHKFAEDQDPQHTLTRVLTPKVKPSGHTIGPEETQSDRPASHYLDLPIAGLLRLVQSRTDLSYESTVQ
jgi:hypothetical protein